MSAIKLSVVIITHNEERNIGRCLESLRGVADDVLVLDSGSTDRTTEICLEYGARVHQHVFDGFAEQKNRANAMAKYDHILSLDADEELTESLRNSISLKKHNFAAAGYRIKRRTIFCGRWIRHSGWYPDAKLRLFDRRKGEWKGAKIHEAFILHSAAPTPYLEGDMMHYSFHTIEQHTSTVNKYSTLKAELMYDQGRKGSLPAMIIAPLIKFVKQYFFKLGILDGWQGLLIAANSAHGVFLKYIKLRQMHRLDQGKL
jgi:glycosyltransferase involved in cell wall biosynthesis